MPGKVCWSCVFQLGGAVAHPETLAEGERAIIREFHGDVVVLDRLGNDDEEIRYEWRWKA